MWRCPECVRAGKAHCAHQALYKRDRRSAVGARKKPSVVRDAMCKELWEREILCEGDEYLRAQMGERAVDGIDRGCLVIDLLVVRVPGNRVLEEGTNQLV